MAIRLAKLRRRRASTAAHAQGHHYYVGTRLTSAMFQQLVFKTPNVGEGWPALDPPSDGAGKWLR